MASEFDFLQGFFDVRVVRLRDPLDARSGWVELAATSSALVLFDGGVSIDEMWFPGEQRFGMSLRLWDPNSATWTARRLTSTGGGLGPPAEGVWADGRCRLTGPDEYEGRPVLASHSWSRVTESGARWERCFSLDGGRSWQPNLVMHLHRRDAGVEHPQRPRVATDFDFLTGRWNVHHRRALDPVGQALGRGSEIAEFDGAHVGRTFFAGAVSVDESTLGEPGQRGLTFRTYDAGTRQWFIHWVNSKVGRLEPPVRGGFCDGVGTFHGTERLSGQLVQVRFVWSGITETTACWQQSFRIGDRDWNDNWRMTFTRPTSEVTA